MAVAELVGVQEPRVCWVPPAVSTSVGREAVDLARSAGLVLDSWQEFAIEHMLATRADGKWAAFEVGLCVPRQNGKGGILEARELASLFLLPSKLTIHSAHQFDTSLEAFSRLLDLIDGCPDLRGKLAPKGGVKRSHGEEGITLRDGSRLRFRTRTKGGGRGFTGDDVILDEAMVISNPMHGALLPTMSARSVDGNPQLLYTGSAVDQYVHEDGVVFARVRERGLAGGQAGLMYMEWSAEGTLEQAEEIAQDERAWALANPALGIRISAEHVGLERESLDPRTFAVERLGVGDWPATTKDNPEIPIQVWRGLTDPGSEMAGQVCFAFDVTPARSYASIGVAGRRSDGLWHVEVIDHHPGDGWVAERLAELTSKHECIAVQADDKGPAGALIPDIENLGVAVNIVTANEHARACGKLVNLTKHSQIRHLGTVELDSAVKGAGKRKLGDAWAWSRSASGVDISPLTTVTFALYAAIEANLGEESGGFEW